MAALAVVGFLVFLGALGLSFDLWTGSLQHDTASIPLFAIPLLGICACYAAWSFVHALLARFWYQSYDDLTIEAHQKRNEHKLLVWGLCVFAAIVYGFFVYLDVLTDPRSAMFSDVFIGSTFPWGTIFCIVAGGTYAYVSNISADTLILGSVAHHTPDPDVIEERAFHHVVDEMSIAAGLPTPRCAIVDDATPNAWAVGIDPAQSTIVVTRKLLTLLTREELQAVVAHEMSHIRNTDARLMTLVTALYGSALLLAGWMRTGGAFSRLGIARPKGRFGPFGIVAGLLAGMFAPLVAQLIALSVSRQREYLADAGAAELTRNPGALADALAKIAAENTIPLRTFRSVAHLCIVDPLIRRRTERTGFLADWFSTHPPVAKRIFVLNALAYRYTSEENQAREIQEA